ncbi:RepB family plasmid replication initiator protein [Rhizobium sp.]|uniref:RepB family plasmid replication initiator protein n=1 Tax=Rhizobium sp. TaxID=391 RepID=UPI0028B008A4
MDIPIYRRRTRRDNNVLTGADRRGFQGPEAVLEERILADLVQPRFELPAVLIETMRLAPGSQKAESAAGMTAGVQALLFLLLANARLHLSGENDQEFTLGSAAAQNYLGLTRIDRLRAGLDTINRTRFTCDLRLNGFKRTTPRPLMVCDLNRQGIQPDWTIGYRLHPALVHIMRSSRRYAMLELNAFRRFRSKYAARLYPMLALTAGQSIAKPLAFSPKDLAARLAWTPDEFHWGSFEARVLQPMLADFHEIDGSAPAITAFRTECKLVRGSGRGRPVQQVLFHVMPTAKSVRHWRPERLGAIEAAIARAPLPGLAAEHTPAIALVAQAAMAKSRTVVQIRDDWAATVRSLMKPSNATHRLRVLLDRYGVGIAFAAWIDIFAMVIPPFDDDVTIGPQGDETLPSVPEPSRAERMKENAIWVATHAMKRANNIRPGQGLRPDMPYEFEDGDVLIYADPDMWLMLTAAGVEQAALLQLAFGRIATQTASQMRKSIYNLSGAIAEWDLDRAERVAKAIIANTAAMVRGYSNSKTRTPPKPPAPITDLSEELVTVRRRDARSRADRLRSAA